MYLNWRYPKQDAAKVDIHVKDFCLYLSWIDNTQFNYDPQYISSTFQLFMAVN